MQIIYLHGPSSVGKTALAKALQDALEEPFLHMSFDKVIGLMPQKMNDWTGAHTSSGFSWKNKRDDQGIPTQELHMGPFAHKMQHTFRNVVRNLAKNGHYLIIDDFAFGQENINLWKETLKDFSTLWVGLKAPLEVLEKREKARDGRIIGSARAQYFQFLDNKIKYDIKFDTDAESLSAIIQKIKDRRNPAIRIEIQRIINSITPFDFEELEHINFIKKWLATHTQIFRIAKPATPDTHLVSYFVLIDETVNKLLLVDHKKAGLWLPSGGHVELNEHPKETVKREIKEELGISADFLSHDPVFATVAKTVGQTAGHTDVSFWYILKGCSDDIFTYDKEEFHDISWFSPADIPYHRTDPHMLRFIKKLTCLKLLG